MRSSQSRTHLRRALVDLHTLRNPGPLCCLKQLPSKVPEITSKLFARSSTALISSVQLSGQFSSVQSQVEVHGSNLQYQNSDATVLYMHEQSFVAHNESRVEVGERSWTN
jgi:hypothetical protein